MMVMMMKRICRPPDKVCWNVLSFTDELSFFLYFYQYTALSSRAVDSHQMYYGGSAVGKASTIGTEISPTPTPL